MAKYIYTFGDGKAEGSTGMKNSSSYPTAVNGMFTVDCKVTDQRGV